MNVTITQDNSRIEQLGSNGASIVQKLYDLAVDPNNTVNLQGNIKTNYAYGYQVDYLNNKYNPDFIVSTNNRYLQFEDSNVLNMLLRQGVGDGVGITESQAADVVFQTNWFQNNTNITSFNTFKYFTKANINPPNDLFYGCVNLEDIDMSKVSIIKANEFRGTKITDVNCPELTEISGGSCFYNCTSLKTITNLGNINTICSWCFTDCYSLQTVILPPSITILEGQAFKISLGKTGSMTSITNLEEVTSIGNECFLNQSFLEVDVGTLTKLNTLGQSAFDFCNSIYGIINMPNLLTAAESALRACAGITKIKCLGKIFAIPPMFISKHTYNGTMALTEVYIPYECTSIGNSSFYGCSLLTTIKQYTQSVDNWTEGETPTYTDISRVTIFGESCFRGCSSLNLTPQDIQNATTIGERAFEGVSALSGTLNLPNLTGTLGEYSFANTQISSISSLGNVTKIESDLFSNTNISSIPIPNSVKICSCSIASGTFVPEIIFPEGVKEIVGGQFSTKNNSLTYIEIPSTVTNMGIFFHRSLENSQDNLCTVVIKATTPPTLNYYATWAIDSTRGDKFAGIYVPDASLTAYQNGANAWQHSSIQEKLKPISQLQTDNPTAWAKYNRTSTV